MSRIAIVGAGLAGSLCAGALQGAGHQVHLFEKSRGTGGRLASRRLAGDLGADLGTPYLDFPIDELLRSMAQSWIDAGWLLPWKPRMAQYDPEDRQLVRVAAAQTVLVPAGRSSALTRALMADAQLHSSVRVGRLERSTSSQWQLFDDAGSPLGHFDNLILSAPPAQSADLLGEVAPELATQVRSAIMDPCYVAIYACEQPLALDTDLAFFGGTAGLRRLVCEHTKPERAIHPCYQLLSTADWAREHLEEDPEKVGVQLWQSLVQSLDLDSPQPVQTHTHRWRYGFVDQAAFDGSYWDEELDLGLCGDWCQGANAWDAIASATHLLRAMGLSRP